MKLQYLLPIVAVLALSSLVACDGAEGRKQKYLEQAETNFETGDFEKARINFKNVLQIDPKDIKGREGIAKTLEKLQDWRGAVAQYRTIVEEDPENANAKVKLGQLYLLAKAADLAMTLAEEVLAVNGTHDGGLALKAAAQVQQGKLDAALSNAEQAYKINNKSIDNIVLLASIYSGVSRQDSAIELLERELKSHPESNSIYTLLSQLYIATNRIALAEQSLKKLVDLNPSNISYKSQLARFYEASGKKDEAEMVLVSAVKQNPSRVDSVSALHVFYLQRQDWVKAESVLQDAIKATPDDNEFRFRLAGYYLLQKKNDAARSIYEALLDKDNTTVLKAKNRLAYMATLENKPDDAISMIAEVLQENPSDVEALTLRGGIYLAQGNANGAINDLRTVLNATPDSPDVIKMLGRAHWLNGENQQATDLFKSALSLQPKDIELRVQLSDLLLQSNDVNQAAKQLEIANSMVPDNVRILEKMVQVYLRGQYLDDADSVIVNLRTLQPESPRNAYFAGLVAQGRNKHDEAKVFFDEAIHLKAGAIEPMTAKIKSYIALNQIGEAIAWLDGAIKSTQDNAVAHNLLGELWLAKKDWKKARAAFDKSIEMQPEWWIPYRNMAMAARGAGTDRDALDYLRAVVDKVDSQPLRIECANYAERVDNFDLAIEQYEKVLLKNADNKVIVNNLAMLIVTHKTDEKSLQRAAELSSQLEGMDEPSFLDTAGWVQYMNGNYQRALPLMQQAARRAPEDPSIQYHLALVYLGTSDKESAARYLEKALESEKPFSDRDEATRRLAEIRQQS